jgi:CcmD family protein
VKENARVVKRLLLTGVLLAVPALLAAQQTAPEGFKPFDENARRETLPAAPMVLTAYAIAWIALAFYAFTIWRKLGKVERDFAELRSKTR